MFRFIVLLSLIFAAFIFSGNRKIQAQNATVVKDYLTTFPELETKTNFEDKLVEEKTTIPFETEYVDDSESEYGTEGELEKGITGERIKVFKVTYWRGKESYRTLESEKLKEATNLKVKRGTKIVWRELATDDEGVIRYWRKMNVRATSYDPNCEGCTGRTYSGTPVVVGTCAVDPKVIVMGSHFYVPGYGLCSALDIGGGIKGNKIDLGFPDVKKGWWSARYVDIYLIDGEPKK